MHRPITPATTPHDEREPAMSTKQQQIDAIQKDWDSNPRWTGIKRDYAAADVVRLRGSLQPEYTLARRGAEKLWKLQATRPCNSAAVCRACSGEPNSCRFTPIRLYQ